MRESLLAMEVRRFETSDGPAVRELHEVALASTGADRGDGPWDDDLGDILTSYIHADGSFLVVMDGLSPRRAGHDDPPEPTKEDGERGVARGRRPTWWGLSAHSRSEASGSPPSS